MVWATKSHALNHGYGSEICCIGHFFPNKIPSMRKNEIVLSLWGTWFEISVLLFGTGVGNIGPLSAVSTHHSSNFRIVLIISTCIGNNWYGA